MNTRLSALLGIGIAALLCAGCGTLTGGPAKAAPSEGGAANSGTPDGGPSSGRAAIGPAELDELTRAFADRYVGLLTSARDALKKDNPDPVQRREAQDLLVSGATNIYDIATNSDGSTRVLDLIVVTTLVSQVWIDDGKANAVFGVRAEPLVRALHQGRVQAWALAAQVFRADQLNLLDYLLWNWRRYNPDIARVYGERIQFVRFSDFAVGPHKSAETEVLTASGLFANVGQASKAIDEARLFSERMFYQLKREPTLLRWQAEELQDSALAGPGLGQAFADVHRLTNLAGQLPKDVAAERQALLTSLDGQMNRADATVANVKSTLSEAGRLVASLGQAGDSLNESLKTADALFARYESWSKQNPVAPSRPFDIREYTAAMKELALSADKLNQVLMSSNELLGSPAWDRRVREVSESADERVKKAVERSQRVVNHFFWRAYAALGIVFVMSAVCLATAYVLMRRLIVKVAGNTAKPGGPYREA